MLVYVTLCVCCLCSTVVGVRFGVVVCVVAWLFVLVFVVFGVCCVDHLSMRVWVVRVVLLRLCVVLRGACL